MTRSEMVERIAEKTGLSKDEVSNVLSAFVDVLTTTVNRGEKVLLSGFGSFFTFKYKKKPLFGEGTGKGFWTTLKFQPSKNLRGTWKSTP